MGAEFILLARLRQALSRKLALRIQMLPVAKGQGSSSSDDFEPWAGGSVG